MLIRGNSLETTTELDKKSRKNSRISESFLKETGQASWISVLGFSLAQCWLALCFFAPQLFDAVSTSRVYELSLGVCAISLIPGIIAARKVEQIAHKRRIIYPVSIVATIGTLLVPFAVINGEPFIPIMALAALLTGFASAWLFIAWYRVFCQLKDAAGFVLSVAAQSLLLYVLTNFLLPPTFSPWILVIIAALMPLVSAVCLSKAQPSAELHSLTYEIKALTPDQLRALINLCAGMFVISFACEFMRNQYLAGSDLVYYSDSVNLAMLLLKIAFSVIIVASVAKGLDRVPILYKVSFFLIIIALLYLPYLDPSIGYGLTNFGAFFFKIVIMLVAFSYCQTYKLSPVLIFSMTRLTWALDLLLAYALYLGAGKLLANNSEIIGLISVSIGLLVIFTYLMVMTDFGGDSRIAVKKPPKPESASDIELRCDVLAKSGNLSKREREVLGHIARGRSAPRIQEELSLSINTVNSHISHIYRKLGVGSRQELLDLIEVSSGEKSPDSTKQKSSRKSKN